jgi:hypothetical protein
VGQLIEKGMKVIFENQHCCIFYAAGCKILQVRMKSKSFSFLPFEEDIMLSQQNSIILSYGTKGWGTAINKGCLP